MNYLDKATFIANADQAYADSQVKLDRLIGALVEDMQDRDNPSDSDSPYWATSLFKVTEAIAELGRVSDDLMAVYMAAVYRLARQQLPQDQL